MLVGDGDSDSVGVDVGVLVGVLVGVDVGVLVGVDVGVLVGVEVGVLVGVELGVMEGDPLGEELVVNTVAPDATDMNVDATSLTEPVALAPDQQPITHSTVPGDDALIPEKLSIAPGVP